MNSVQNDFKLVWFVFSCNLHLEQRKIQIKLVWNLTYNKPARYFAPDMFLTCCWGGCCPPYCCCCCCPYCWGCCCCCCCCGGCWPNCCCCWPYWPYCDQLPCCGCCCCCCGCCCCWFQPGWFQFCPPPWLKLPPPLSPSIFSLISCWACCICCSVPFVQKYNHSFQSLFRYKQNKLSNIVYNFFQDMAKNTKLLPKRKKIAQSSRR